MSQQTKEFGPFVDARMGDVRTSAKKLGLLVGASHVAVSTWIDTNRWPQAVVQPRCAALAVELEKIDGLAVYVALSKSLDRSEPSNVA